jgi:serine/threonine protein kinase
LDYTGHVKIGDFGVGKIFEPNELIKDQCGTPAYIAPEILSEKGYYRGTVDLWSAGVVLYAMLQGTTPFKGHGMKELHDQILSSPIEFKEDISEEAKSLIMGLLERDVHKRLTVSEALKHPFLAKETKASSKLTHLFDLFSGYFQ